MPNPQSLGQAGGIFGEGGRTEQKDAGLLQTWKSAFPCLGEDVLCHPSLRQESPGSCTVKKCEVLQAEVLGKS